MGRIWICTIQGVYLAEPETINIEKFPQIPRETADIAETDDGSVVAVCWDRGVYYLDARTGETTLFPNATVNPKGIGDQFIKCVTVDKMNRIWIGTPTGLVLFNPSRISFTHYPTEREVVSIEEDRDGRILLGSGAGLYIFNPENGKIDKIASDPGVRAMTIDNQGSLWCSSYKGLWQRLPKSLTFQWKLEMPTYQVMVYILFQYRS